MLKYFDAGYYLSRYKDVAAAVAAGTITAEQHYLTQGDKEGRQPSIYFDPIYYLAHNPDVAKAQKTIGTTLQHFIQAGEAELRNPSAFMDIRYYLANNVDVASAVYRGETTPFAHFITSGVAELRSGSPFFDPVAYLAANNDVAAAHISPYTHFATNGITEQRNLGNGIKLQEFVKDPVFNTALYTGQFGTAFARVAQVAPFLSSFVKPDGYTYDTNLSFPVDFVANGSTKLIIPDGVTIPKGTTLTPVFVAYYAPKLVSLLPADNAVDLAPDTTFVFTFDQIVKQGKGSVIFTDSGSTAVVKVDITNSEFVTFSDTTLEVKPAGLLEGLHYSITVDTTAVVNPNSVAFAGIKSSTAYDVSLTPKTIKITSGDEPIVATLAGEIFTISTLLNPAPEIIDFAVGTDKLSLSKSAFSTITSKVGTLQTADFFNSSTLVDPATSVLAKPVIFDKTSGILYYNTDGAIAGGLEQIVTLTGVTTLSVNEILVA